MTIADEPTEAELAEARRCIANSRLALVPEDLSCFRCRGRRLLSDCSPAAAAVWADVRKFNPDAKTLCALAWDPYNTDGDCLAEK